MLNISGIIGKFIKSSSQRDIDKLKSVVKQINAWEPKIKEIPDEKFPSKTLGLKSKISGIILTICSSSTLLVLFVFI